MVGELTPEEIENVLQEQLMGHLGCHFNNITYIVPICFAYDSNCIYARTYEGIKMNMMRQNSNVCFQVESLMSMVDWKSVVCQGKFEELIDKEKREKGIQILHSRVQTLINNNSLKTSRHWPFSSIHSNSQKVDGILFCIHLTTKTGKFETDDSEPISYEKGYSFRRD